MANIIVANRLRECDFNGNNLAVVSAQDDVNLVFTAFGAQVVCFRIGSLSANT